jgi:hypothetical protein
MKQSIEQFVQQLAVWTEDVIEHGRTPFRRVDTFPEIDTENGYLKPELVFWINRQSLMAGGVLLIQHENTLKQLLAEGKLCATALGLNFFVTWETKQVRIWQITGDAIEENQSFTLANPEQPETFKLLLHDLLDALKLLAVLKSIPPRELAATYFNNLFRITLELTQPSYTKAIRSRRSDQDGEIPIASDQLARDINRLTLLQILTLFWQQQLNEPLLPDNLDAVLEQELQQLPEDLQSGLLSATDNTISMPAEASVFFNHLILRLRQLAWTNAEERLNASMQRLIESWFSINESKSDAFDFDLHPLAIPLAQETSLVLSESPLFLAATALLRRVNNCPAVSLKRGHILQLTHELDHPGRIHAQFSDELNVVKTERKQLIMQLRLSWPSRRFKVTTGQPLWLWETMHLIGLCATKSDLLIELPPQLVKVPLEHPLWETLASLKIIEITCTTDQPVRLLLRKMTPKSGHYRLKLGGEKLSLPRSTSAKILRNQLLLALQLPAETFTLLARAFVWPKQNNEILPERPGTDLYRQSRLCQLLYRLSNSVADDKSPGLPYPTLEFLSGL